MSDRELLELAAKAAGIEVVWLESSFYGPTMARVEFKSGDGEITEPWNPLTDDGDALRLAVKLHIGFKYHDNSPPELSLPRQIAIATHGNKWLADSDLADPYAATRRAIVRAAAEIGKEMK